MNNQDIMFGYTSLHKNSKNRKMLINYFDEYPKIFLIDSFLIKEYNLFSQNTESSLEQ